MIKNTITAIFKKAGITINWDKTYDIQVLNNKFYLKLFLFWTIALWESYVDWYWEVKKLDKFIYKVLKWWLVNTKTYELKHFWSSFLNKLRLITPLLKNPQSKKRAKNDVWYHYNLWNDLFEATLGKTMNYTCWYFKNAKTLDKAQKDKMDLVCQKLYLKPWMKVLDIGCWWWWLAKFMADNYKVKVVWITLSKNQYKYAKKYCKDSNVKIILQDYRDLKWKFDRITSIEMIEHVWPKNLNKFMNITNKCLKKDGLMLLQFDGKSQSINWNDAFIEKYLFPWTVTPSIKQIASSIEWFFSIVDLHDFTEDYHKTMIAWHKNFTKNWSKIKNNYDKRFFRLWEFYLLSCPATALAKTQHLRQIVFQKENSTFQYIREN